MAEDAGAISARIELGIADLKRQIVEATTALKSVESELGKMGTEAGKAGKKIKESVQAPKTPFQSFFNGLKTGFKETGKEAEDAGKKFSKAFGPIGIVLSAVTAAIGVLTDAFKRVGEGNGLKASKQDAENVNFALNTMKKILDGIAYGAEVVVGLFGKLAKKVEGLSDEEVVLANRQEAVADATEAVTKAQAAYNKQVEDNNRDVLRGAKLREQADQEEKTRLETLIKAQTGLYEAYQNQADALKARNDTERRLAGTRIQNITDQEIATEVALKKAYGMKDEEAAVYEARLRETHQLTQKMLDEERAAYDNTSKKANDIRVTREKLATLTVTDNAQLTKMGQIYESMEAAIAANAVELEKVNIKQTDGALGEKAAAEERKRANNALYESLTQYAALASKTALDAQNSDKDRELRQKIYNSQKNAEYAATEQTAEKLTAIEKIYKDVEAALAQSVIAEEELNIAIADGAYQDEQAEAERLKIANERYKALTKYAALAKLTALDETKAASDQTLLEDILAKQKAETFTQTEKEADALTDVEQALEAQALALAFIAYEEGEGVKKSVDANKARKAALEGSLQILREIVRKETEAGGASIETLTALEETRDALEEVNQKLGAVGKQTLSFEEQFNLTTNTITQAATMIGDAIVNNIGKAVQKEKDEITELHDQTIKTIEETFTTLMETLADERQRALEEAGLAQAETELGLAEAMEAAIASGDDMVIYREKQRQKELAINKKFDAQEKAERERKDAEIEAADKTLKKKLAEEDYKLAVATWHNQLIQAIINTAAAITTNLATVGMPAGGILAAAAGTLGSIQIGIITANKPEIPAFKLGGVVGLPATWGSPWSGTASQGRPVYSYQNGGMVGGGIAGVDAQPVIVSSREMILTEADQANLLEMIRGGETGEIQLTINNIVDGVTVSTTRQVVDILNSGLGGKIDNRIIAR
jgi:hypothetical protein